jgi:hypothetical protein
MHTPHSNRLFHTQEPKSLLPPDACTDSAPRHESSPVHDTQMQAPPQKPCTTKLPPTLSACTPNLKSLSSQGARSLSRSGYVFCQRLWQTSKGSTPQHTERALCSSSQLRPRTLVNALSNGCTGRHSSTEGLRSPVLPLPRHAHTRSPSTAYDANPTQACRQVGSATLQNRTGRQELQPVGLITHLV